MDDEITKEIKTLDELEQNLIDEEDQEETLEEDNSEEEKEEETKEKKPINKKILIIGGIILAVILLIIIILVIVLNKNNNKEEPKKSNESKFVTTLKESLKSGDFDDAIATGLSDTGIKADKVCIINMDIDSDDEQELVVYAEDSSKKGLLQLEIDDEITYDDHYLLDAKDSIGYAYSSEKSDYYWYTEVTKNYTIVSNAKKIIKEEDFLTYYFSLTKTYKEKPILDQCTEYNMDKKLDAKKLEKNAITNKMIIKDNKIDAESVKEAYNKYLKEKEEKDAKEKAEAEAKAKEEELKQKLAGQLVLGNKTYKYGTYNLYNADEEIEGTMVLYSDQTCTYKGVNCTFAIGEIRAANDELVPGFALKSGVTGVAFITSEDEGILIEPEEGLLAKYSG